MFTASRLYSERLNTYPTVVAEIYDHHMPSPVPRMKDDLNCSVFSFLSYKSFNKIFLGLVHTNPEIF